MLRTHIAGKGHGSCGEWVLGSRNRRGPGVPPSPGLRERGTSPGRPASFLGLSGWGKCPPLLSCSSGPRGSLPPASPDLPGLRGTDPVWPPLLLPSQSPHILPVHLEVPPISLGVRVPHQWPAGTLVVERPNLESFHTAILTLPSCLLLIFSFYLWLAWNGLTYSYPASSFTDLSHNWVLMSFINFGKFSAIFSSNISSASLSLSFYLSSVPLSPFPFYDFNYIFLYNLMLFPWLCFSYLLFSLSSLDHESYIKHLIIIIVFYG